MVIGKVVDNVVSTRKHEAMHGVKLLVIEPILGSNDQTFVAADEIGVGIGEYVLVTMGAMARYALDREIPIDAVVVGILDHEPAIKG